MTRIDNMETYCTFNDTCASSVCNTLFKRWSMRLYEPYLAQWPGLSQRPSPARTNLKMRQKTST